jgi:hypothetical protein
MICSSLGKDVGKLIVRVGYRTGLVVKNLQAKVRLRARAVHYVQ